FLKTRYRVAHFIGENAVNRAAIVSQPAQISLQRAEISRLNHQLFVGLEIIDPTPVISPRKISGAHRRHLMEQAMVIARRQRIDRMKGKDLLVDDESRSAVTGEKHRDKNKPESFHQRIPTSLAVGTSGAGSRFPSLLFGQSGQSSCSSSGPKWLRSSCFWRSR